ncbi:MAG: DUF4404 family protein [Anaerolineales bacterium]|nr:DUF4404 family protein [Anaerolineales bacterium]
MDNKENQTQVHTLLRQLHHELRHVDQISDRDRELLNHLSQHLEAALAQAGQPDEPLSSRLEAAVAELTTTHATIVSLLNQISAALSNMGI